MVAEPKRWFITPEEYLEGERLAETKGFDLPTLQSVPQPQKA